MRRKLAKVAIVAALLASATAPASALSICDAEPTTFEIWFAQQIFC